MTPHDESEEQVRGLLGAAADPGDEQMPADVASRLDDVLAGLVAERETAPDAPGTSAAAADAAPAAPTGAASDAGSRPTGVTDLSTRRRRRWYQGLAAAAAVAVVGMGVGTLVNGAGDEAADSSAAGSAGMAESGARGQHELSAPEAARDRESGKDVDSVNGLGLGPLQRLRSESLTVDVQRIEDFALAVPVHGYARTLSEACVPATRRGDDWLPVRLDGERAVLVLRAPEGGRRTAEVYTCDGAAQPAAETTVETR